MRQFKWRRSHLESIESLGLSSAEVEAAFERVHQLREQPDGTYEMLAEMTNGQRVRVVWSFAVEDEPRAQVSLAGWSRR